MAKRTLPLKKTASCDCFLFSALPGLRDSWLLACEIRQCTSSTLRNRKGLIDRLIWFGNERGLTVLDTPALEGFFQYLLHGHEQPGGRWGNPLENTPVKAGTVATYHRILTTFFNYLVKQETITTSPLAKIPAPVNRPDQVNPLSDDQLLALLAAARKSIHPKRDEAMLLLLLDTGLRVGEMTALTIGDCDLSRRMVTVKAGKGNKARYVPFSAEVCKALFEYLRERKGAQPTEPLFTADRGISAGEHIGRHGIWLLLKRMAKRAGVDPACVSAHKFRHTFAISYLRAGGGQFALMSTLGHTNMQMTGRYVKIASADVEAAHKQFSPVAHLKGRKGK